MSWITEWIEERRIRKAAERKRLAEERARDAVQIREFGNELYLSMNDVPLVLLEDMKDEPVLVLDAARKAYAEYFARG